jgi:hypothetical protein
MRLVLILSPGILLAAGCGVADVPGPTSAASNGAAVTEQAHAGNTVTEDGTCSPPAALSADDVAKLPKCECKSGGHARCVPSSSIPGSLSNQLESCDDDKGACVPDTVLSLGDKSLPVCKASGKDGRCLSVCVPMVAKYADSGLTRGDGDACPSDERCVPCENPLDGTATGVCDIGKSANATSTCAAGGSKAPDGSPPSSASTAPAKGKACCAIGGVNHGTCMASSQISSDLRSRLTARECDSSELCVPNDAGSKPVLCNFGMGTCASRCEEHSVLQSFVMDLGECPDGQQCVPIGME